MLFTIVGVVGFLWFLAPIFMYGSLNLGNLTGMIIFALFIVYGLKKEKIKALLKRASMSNVYYPAKICISIILIVLVSLISVETGLMVKACTDKPSENSTVVVLGCRVMPGERPSLMLCERLEAAYKYLEANPTASCIVSGGQGEDEDISEAECMYRYLVNKGISKDRIYLEDRSTSTRENLAFSASIIKEENLPSEIAIITNEFHEYRASLVANDLGLNHSAVPARTEWWLFPTYYVRELYGIIYEWLL